MEEAGIVGYRVTTAYNAVKHRGRLKPGDSALVIGCGGIGLTRSSSQVLRRLSDHCRRCRRGETGSGQAIRRHAYDQREIG